VKDSPTGGGFFYFLVYYVFRRLNFAPFGTNTNKENKMDRKFGYYIFGGLLIGAVFGLLWAGNGNPILGIGIGAFAGAAIGWFIAAAALERETRKK
jgi:hypothetical protein